MKSKLNYVIKFLAFMLLFFVLSRAGVNGEIYPFAFAMLFALAWANQKVWLLAPAYLIGCIANNYSFEGIISTVVTVLLLVLPYYVHIAIKKPMFKWELFIFAGLSQVSFVVFSALSGMQIYYIVLSIVVGLVYLYLSVFVFESLLRRGFSYKLTLPEVIAGGIILMSVASGLTSCNFFGFSFLKLFVAFCLLAISQVTSSGRTMIFASLMGLGSLISGNNPIYMAPFIIWALAIIAFKFSNRIFSAMALLLSEVLIIFYFDLYYGFSVASFLPVPIAAVIFLAIPKNFYQSLSLLLSTGSERSGVKCLLNRNRDLMQRRLNRLGEVFYDMNAVFRSLIKKEASEDEIKEMLYEELKSSICKNCPEHKHCHRTFSEDTRKIFINLVSIAFARGKITLLDLPSYLSSRCSQAGRLISEVNTLTSQYKNYSQLVGNIDTSKLLTKELRQELEKIFVEGEEYKNLYVTILSFGFKYGIPTDADLVFDVRFLPNPYYVAQLQKRTGEEPAVQEYVMQGGIAKAFLDKLFDLLEFLIPNYILEGKNQLVIGIGCTGGKHRSVTIAKALYDRLKENSGYGTKLFHRDMEKDGRKKQAEGEG